MAIRKTFTVSKFNLSGLLTDKADYQNASEDMFNPAPHWIGSRLISKIGLEYLKIDEKGNVLASEKETDIYKLNMASITLKLGMQIALFSYSDVLLEIPNKAANITLPGQDMSMLRLLVENISRDMEVIWNNAYIILPDYAYVYGKSIKAEGPLS